MANTTGVADHKATGPAIPGLTVERTKAIILLIVQLFSVAQTGLSIAGISQLPFTTDQVSTAITGVIAVIASVYAWWRNNNLTGAAAGRRGAATVGGAQDGGDGVPCAGAACYAPVVGVALDGLDVRAVVGFHEADVVHHAAVPVEYHDVAGFGAARADRAGASRAEHVWHVGGGQSRERLAGTAHDPADEHRAERDARRAIV